MPIVIGIHHDENEIIEDLEDEEEEEENGDEEDEEDEEETVDFDNEYAIDLAILCNYEANLNPSDFNTITIPSLTINYNDFVKLAFNNNPEVFDIYMMDKLFKHLKMSLVNTFLTEYEKKQNTNRNMMDSSVKIKLIKEFSFDNLSNIIKKKETLNLKEFNVAIGSTHAKQRSISAKINTHLYSNILGIGIIIPFLFKIQNIPHKLTNENENISYDFSNREHKIIYYVEVNDHNHHTHHTHNTHHTHHPHHPHHPH